MQINDLINTLPHRLLVLGLLYQQRHRCVIPIEDVFLNPQPCGGIVFPPPTKNHIDRNASRAQRVLPRLHPQVNTTLIDLLDIADTRHFKLERLHERDSFTARFVTDNSTGTRIIRLLKVLNTDHSERPVNQIGRECLQVLCRV